MVVYKWKTKYKQKLQTLGIYLIEPIELIKKLSTNRFLSKRNTRMKSFDKLEKTEKSF